MRYAIYFTPPAHDPLLKIATQWLGRDAFQTESVALPCDYSKSQTEAGKDEAWVTVPQRYGFHATLKAPFRLADEYDEQQLINALEEFSSRSHAVTLPQLKLASIGHFFVLVPEDDCPALQQLANDISIGFDRFRAPLNAAEMEKRQPDRLSPSQRRNLEQWGYPYLFEDFRFHMTLTGSISQAEQQQVKSRLEELLESELQKNVTITDLALFIEPEPGAPFMVHSIYPLGQ